jgi:mannose-6-phosphate isomerase-like protein (cupin superfamily)
MQAFEFHEAVAAQGPAAHSYEDYLRSDLLSVGVAVWRAGASDEQRPHAEDEVYFCVSGRGWLRVGEEERSVGAGSVLLVGAGVEHRFHDISEDLEVLVFWAPPHLGKR